MHKLSVFVGQDLVYFQLIDNEKNASAAIAHTMELPQGEGSKVVIEFKGNKIEFNTSHVDVGALMRKANGITVRTRKGKAEELAAEA